MGIRYDRCPNCMKELQGEESVCSNCGFDIKGYKEKPNCLRPFTVLENKYMIGRVIGVGGFGITYIGWDLNLQTYIAIKEYFPDSLASRDTSIDATKTAVIAKESTVDLYNKGLKRYVEEAQNISRFYNLKGIVSVKDFFYANETAYIVMEYINGINLKEYLKNCGGRLDEATVLALMKPVFESLFQIHKTGLIHRDISPDNIMVDANGEIKLIDFGSARGQSQETDKTYTVILKHGYAPSEQYYAKGNQGPWTDIYSLCATMYKMLTGQIPPNSVERMENDEYRTPSSWGIPISPRTEAVLNKGLAVRANDRYQNIGELLTDLYGSAPITNMAGMPAANSTSYNNPTSMSQQSMHLNMQPQYSNQNGSDNGGVKKNMKPFIFIGIGVLVVIGVIIAILVGGKKKDKDKDTETNTTETASTAEPGSSDASTTEEASTEGGTTEAVEPQASGYKYEWPESLSDDWRDYEVSIDGTVYKLPIPYTEWKLKGWKSDSLPTSVSSGTTEYCTFTLDGITCYATLTNYGMSEAELNECFVTAMSFELEDMTEAKAETIMFASEITMNKSTESDIKAAYGAPDNVFSDDEGTYTEFDYVGDEYTDGIDLKVGESGTLIRMSLATSNLPEGYVPDTNIGTDVPEINNGYVAPIGPSQSREDGIFTIEGINYKLPVPVSEFLANGWSIDSKVDDYVCGEDSIVTSIEKDGCKIDIYLTNYTTSSIIPANAIVTRISVEDDYCDKEVIFPGNMKLGDQGSVFADVYGDLGDNYSYDDEYDYFDSYYAYIYDAEGYDSIRVSAYTDKNTGELTDLEYYVYCKSIPY